MIKVKSSVRRLPILLLVLALLAIPLLGTACGDDDEGIEASFEASVTTGIAPLVVQFTDTSTGDIVAWQWDFGDGGTSTEQSPTHTFGEEAMYTVTLKVIGADGEDTATVAINATGIVYQEMSLDLNNPFPETDPSGQGANKFKELLELYTDGNVSVNVFHGGQLYDMYSQFEPLKQGAIDVGITNPGNLAGVNPKLASFVAVRGIVANFEHGRKLIADQAFMDNLRGTYEDYNVRFLDYIEAYLMVGWWSPNTEMTDYADFDGKTYWWGQPGKAAPLENMFNPITVYYPMSELAVHLMNGDIDISCMPPNVAYDYGFYELFNYLLLSMVYTPNCFLMNLDTWNDMEPELQELINDVIMPQVQTYCADLVVEVHKQALLVINTVFDAVHVVSPEREQVVWDMLQTDADFLALKAMLDPDALAIMENLRPANPTMDQDVIDILTFANIPIPE